MERQAQKNPGLMEVTHATKAPAHYAAQKDLAGASSAGHLAHKVGLPVELAEHAAHGAKLANPLGKAGTALGGVSALGTAADTYQNSAQTTEAGRVLGAAVQGGAAYALGKTPLGLACGVTEAFTGVDVCAPLMSTVELGSVATEAALTQSTAPLQNFDKKMSQDDNLSGLLYNAGKAKLAPEAMKKDSMAGQLRFEEKLADVPGVGVAIAANRALAGDKRPARRDGDPGTVADQWTDHFGDLGRIGRQARAAVSDTVGAAWDKLPGPGTLVAKR